MKMDNDNNSNEDRIMYLKQRKKALTLLLQEKNELLRRLCLQEADITGVIPSEIPESSEVTTDSNYVNDANVNLTLRRKVETGFKLSENLLANSISNEDDEVSKLLLEKQVQTSISEAALNMANNLSNNKAVRRKHRHMYKQSQEKLARINETLGRKLSQTPKVECVENNEPLSIDNNVVEDNFNHITSNLPVQLNEMHATSSRFSEFIPDNYYPQHPLPAKEISKQHISYSFQGDLPHVTQMRQIHYQNSIVPQNHHSTNSKLNIHMHNKSRKKPRPPVDEYSIKRDHISLSLPKYNIDNQEQGYVDQLHNHMTEYRNTMASEPFFTYPRKDYYQNHIEESLNHNQEYYYEQDVMPVHSMQRTHRLVHNLNHNSEKNLFGSLDRRKINMSPMLTDTRNTQKIKIPNRSQSIGELKMAEDVTDNISISSHNSGNTPKERQWHETSLDDQPLRSPVKMRAKSSAMQYDITVDTTYNERNNRTPPTGKYNYDYVDTQYLQQSPITPSNQNYENMYEKNNVVYVPTLQLHPKRLGVMPQPQPHVVVTKPAMPSPRQYYEHNHKGFCESPLRESQIEQIVPLRNGNEIKQFLSPKTVPVESPQNIEVISPGTWCPYKEVSKPFEMSDFYKYSTKFRNKQVVSSDNSPVAKNNIASHSNMIPDLKPQFPDYIEANADPIQKGVYQPLRPLKCQPYLIHNHNVEYLNNVPENK